jgi:hypothetical protein
VRLVRGNQPLEKVEPNHTLSTFRKGGAKNTLFPPLEKVEPNFYPLVFIFLCKKDKKYKNIKILFELLLFYPI